MQYRDTHSGKPARGNVTRAKLHFLWLYAPLAGHIVPTLIIGFCFVIPGSPIEGINTYTLGFLAAVLGLIPAYTTGVAIAKRSRKAV